MQCALEVVGEVCYGGVARARSEFDRVLRHDRSLHRVAKLSVHAEELERGDEALAHLSDVAVVRGAWAERIEKGERRQNVRPLVLDWLFLRVFGLGALCGGWRRWRCFALLRCLRRLACSFAFGFCRLFRCAYRVLLGLAGRRLFGLCPFLFEPCLLFFEPRLLLGFLLCLERGEIGRLLLLVLLVGACGFARRRGMAGGNCPAVDGREKSCYRLYAYARNERDYRENRHYGRAAEVAEERRDEACHDEIADYAAGVCDVDALKRSRNPWRVVLRNLQKACARRGKEYEPRGAAAEVELASADEA